jgi:hypothetical protein
MPESVMIPRIEVYRDETRPPGEQWAYRVYSKSSNNAIAVSTRHYPTDVGAQHGAWALVAVCNMVTEIKRVSA